VRRQTARCGLGLLVLALVGALGVVAATGLAAGSARTSAGDNPVGEWHLDTSQSNAGTHVVETPDSSGNGLDATIVGTSVAGRFDNAFAFSSANANGAVVAQPGVALKPQNVTLLTWVKRSGSPGNYKYVLAKGARQCAAASYALESGPSGGLVFYIDDGTQAHSSPDAGHGVWDGNWHMVAGTFDGSTVRLYVDGSEIGSGTAAKTDIGYAAAITSTDFTFGYYPASTCGASFQWDGSLDEARVYSRALTDAELRYLGTATGPNPPELPAPTAATTTTTTAKTSTTTSTTTSSAPRSLTPPSVQVAAGIRPGRIILPTAGSSLLCDPGTWSGSPTLAYVWFAGVPVPSSGSRQRIFPRTTVQVGTGQTLTLPDYPPSSTTISCEVTATNAVGASQADAPELAVGASKPTQQQICPIRGRVALHCTPGITANVGVGATNHCTPGTWVHYPTSYDFAWYSLGAKHSRVGLRVRTLLHAGPDLSIKGSMEGDSIECAVTARNKAGGTEAVTNSYVVPIGAPAVLQGPFVDVTGTSPSVSGLVGPNDTSPSFVAEHMTLTCKNGRWSRGDLTYTAFWQYSGVGDFTPVSYRPTQPRDDAKYTVQGGTWYAAGWGLTFLMGPGDAGTPDEFDGWVQCMVEARTPHGVVAVASSAKIHVTNGCWIGLEKDNEPDAHNNPSDDRVFTGGPNCRDYQRWYEAKGWTVKQSDANASPYDSGGGIPWLPFP
jgi:hypothetical protein